MTRVRIIAVLAALAFTPGWAKAAVVLDGYAAAYIPHANTSPSSLTYSLTVGNNPNRAIVVFIEVATQCDVATPTVTGVTYAGVALSQIQGVTENCLGFLSYLYVFSLPAGTQPAVGMHDIVITLSGALPSNHSLHSAAISAAGVDQTTTFSSTNANADAGAGTPISLTLSLSGANDLVANFATNGTLVSGPEAPQTLRMLRDIDLHTTADNSALATAPGGTTTLTWDVDALDGTTGIAAVSFKAAAPPASIVTVDAVGPSSSGQSALGASSLSWSHTCSGASSLLVTSIAVSDTNVIGDQNLSASMTYNGVAMTSAGRVHTDNDNAGYIELFYLLAPAIGTHTVAATIAGGTAALEGGSISFNGVDQTTPLRNLTTAAHMDYNDPNIRGYEVVVPSAIGNMVVDAAASSNNIVSSEQTIEWMNNQGNSAELAGNAAMSVAPGAAWVRMGYTLTDPKIALMGLDIVASGTSGTSGITIVHTAAGTASGLGGNTVTIPIRSTGAGNLLVVGAMEGGDAFTVTGVSDGTNSFTQVPGALATSTPFINGTTDLWYLPSSSAGKTLITITYSGTDTDYKGGWYWEVKGPGGPVTLDGVNAVNNALSPNFELDGAAVTTTASQGLVIAVDVNELGVTNPLPGSGFVWGNTLDFNGDGGGAFVTTSAGTYWPQWGTASPSHYAASTAAFKWSTAKVRHQVRQD